MLRTIALVIVAALAPFGAAFAGYWDGTWMLRSADGDPHSVLIVVVSGDAVTWWVPDDATMRAGEAIVLTETTLAFSVGSRFGDTQIRLTTMGRDVAEGQSQRPDGSMVTGIAAMRQDPS